MVIIMKMLMMMLLKVAVSLLLCLISSEMLWDLMPALIQKLTNIQLNHNSTPDNKTEVRHTNKKRALSLQIII